ncbi:MAG: hypothetical protein CM1200mP28_15570 [Deltaproteobacteria bacterium]|nr:MAG: hypothetical protein CM1200mP28_15570 [Deltaproteobacteria bacterium]
MLKEIFDEPSCQTGNADTEGEISHLLKCLPILHVHTYGWGTTYYVAIISQYYFSALLVLLFCIEF